MPTEKEVKNSSAAGANGGVPKPVDLRIPALTVVKVAATLVGLYVIYRLLDVVVMVFVALLLASLIDPFADWFANRNIPRGIAVLIVYVVLFGVVGGALILLIPPLFRELSALVENFASLWGRVAGAFVNLQELSAQYGIGQNIQRGLESFERGLVGWFSGIFGTIRGFFGGLVSIIIVFVLTFYMVVEEDVLRRLFRSVAPAEYQPYLAGLLSRAQKKIGAWLRGELVLMLIVGVFSYVGLLILGVDYALILGIIAGLAEIIPYAGPIISAVPAVVIAFTQSPLKALFVLVLYFAIQQLENNLLVPKVMQRAVGLNPIVSILALLVGARLGAMWGGIGGGVLGAVLAIPIATALSVLVHDLFAEKEKKEEVV